MDKIKKIPKSEDGCRVIQKMSNDNIYHVTHNTMTNRFTLWKEYPDGYIKIKTANSPLTLYEKIDMLP